LQGFVEYPQCSRARQPHPSKTGIGPTLPGKLATAAKVV
jgi:hypothetical protein